MRCGICNYDEIENTTITLEEWDGEDLIVIRDVPVEKCPQCGEQYFAPSVLREIEKLLEKRHVPPRLQPMQVIQVPVFKYAW